MIGRELVRKGCRLAVLAVRRCESDDVGSERLFGGTVHRESKNPVPVSGTGPSILLGLFHPCASTVSELDCGVISAILNVG